MDAKRVLVKKSLYMPYIELACEMYKCSPKVYEECRSKRENDFESGSSSRTDLIKTAKENNY